MSSDLEKEIRIIAEFTENDTEIAGDIDAPPSMPATLEGMIIEYRMKRICREDIAAIPKCPLFSEFESRESIFEVPMEMNDHRDSR